MSAPFLPVTMEECRRRGWDQPDFVYAVGDAYVDHPSFGHAIISRVLEAAGYRVAMLCLPEYHSAEDFKRFGKPRLGFLVSSGVVDSMVNHYTVAKKRRNADVYAPGGQAGLRPDRAVTVYCNRIHEAYPGVPVLIGGTEASLRRFSHYDYWDDKVRRSVLVDSAATLLMYGMGENVIRECAAWLERGAHPWELADIRGICYMAKKPPADCIPLPSHREASADRLAYARAFWIEYEQQDSVRGQRLCQEQDTQRFLVQNPPAAPLSRAELDAVYALPYQRASHPMYDAQGGVPALAEVRFSISAVRGCFGACNFCALTFHQGRVVTSRSEQSILAEAKLLTQLPDFKGYIHDIGGPTANFHAPACDKQLKSGACKDRQCLYPTPCKNLKVSHKELCAVLRKARALPGVKKVFIRSGIRYDYLLADPNPTFLNELCQHHISGQLKVAPEHLCDSVLGYMGKPSCRVFDEFAARYEAVNRRLGLKQYLVPYLMSSHPGSTLRDAVALAEAMRDRDLHPEQVQDFYPTPGTLSTCMYHTGLDPRTGKPVYVPKSPHEKAMQRALLQWKEPRNWPLIREALRLCGRDDLIGHGPRALVPPEYAEEAPRRGGPTTRGAATQGAETRGAATRDAGHTAPRDGQSQGPGRNARGDFSAHHGDSSQRAGRAAPRGGQSRDINRGARRPSQPSRKK